MNAPLTLTFENSTGDTESLVIENTTTGETLTITTLIESGASVVVDGVTQQVTIDDCVVPARCVSGTFPTVGFGETTITFTGLTPDGVATFKRRYR